MKVPRMVNNAGSSAKRDDIEIIETALAARDRIMPHGRARQGGLPIAGLADEANGFILSNGKGYAIDCTPEPCRRRCYFARCVISDTDDDINAANNSVSLLAVHARRKAEAYLRVIPTQFWSVTRAR